MKKRKRKRKEKKKKRKKMENVKETEMKSFFEEEKKKKNQKEIHFELNEKVLQIIHKRTLSKESKQKKSLNTACDFCRQ